MTMKKRILILLMALAMVVILGACGSSGKTPAGTYNLIKIGSGGEELTIEEMNEIAGMEIEITLELKTDNNFTLDLGILGEGENINGTWKMDGDSLILSAEGDDLSVTYDDKIISMDMEGEILTFEKQ